MDVRRRACEQSLRELAAELAAHRVALQQLNDAIVQNNQDKEVTGQRLDAVFDLVDTRMGKYTEITRNIAGRIDTVDGKADSLTEVIRGLAKNVKAVLGYWAMRLGGLGFEPILGFFVRTLPASDFGEAILGRGIRRVGKAILGVLRTILEEMTKGMAFSPTERNMLIIKRLDPFLIPMSKSNRFWKGFIEVNKNTNSGIGDILTRLGFFR